jgi:hypothetical protein|tara:strand:+ start:2893 stop:3180 length:288 start_codon:yes stop_codon:yes gene_type:complete
MKFYIPFNFFRFPLEYGDTYLISSEENENIITEKYGLKKNGDIISNIEITIDFENGLSDDEKNELIEEKFIIGYNFNSKGVWDDNVVHPKTTTHS